MIRLSFAALLVVPIVPGVAYAQTRPMPAYQDDETYGRPTASDDKANSRDARHDEGYARGYADPPTTHPADRQAGYGGDDDIPPPPNEDEAHRSDRLRTRQLNHRAYVRPDRASDGGRDNLSQGDYARQSAQYRAQLADHERAMRNYGDERARYADRIARWRARADACEAGDIDACQAPE